MLHCSKRKLLSIFDVSESYICNPKAEVTKLRDGIHCNFGRALTGLGEVEEAMKHYAVIKEPDYFSHCGLALASLKGN